ncbi:MAG: signal peptidase I [Caldiserica bacterium]|nr:signal peptidase I [Caldisericota bacterium]
MKLSRRDLGLLGILVFFSFWNYLVYFHGMRFFLVPSASMEPTLKPGDKVITFRIKEIKRGDLVVFLNPRDKKEILVKRVIKE